MLNWIAAIATVVIAGATVAYVVVSTRLWRSTRDMATLTKESLDLSRRIYESTHRPFLSTAIEMQPYQNTDDWLIISCVVANNGSDIARDVKVELKSGIEQYHGIFPFGDLQPKESRSIAETYQVTSSLARAWMEELRQSPAVKFHYSRTFRSGAGSNEAELGDIYCSPSEVVRVRLEGRANRA